MSLKSPVNPRPVNIGENSETCLAYFLQSHSRMIGSVIVKDSSIYLMNRNTQNYEILVFLFNYQHYLGLHTFFLFVMNDVMFCELLQICNLILLNEKNYSQLNLFCIDQTKFLCVLVFLLFINYHKLQWLKTIWIYCFIVSVGQESRHGLSGPPNLNSSYQSGCDLIWDLGFFPNLQIMKEIHFPVTMWLRPCFPCQFSVEDHSVPRGLPFSSCLLTLFFTIGLFGFFWVSRRESLWHFMLKGSSD